MMRKYVITWYKNEKYGNPITRTSTVDAKDPMSAVYSFRSMNGSLKENTVVSIQEVHPKLGTPIGDPIIPQQAFAPAT